MSMFVNNGRKNAVRRVGDLGAVLLGALSLWQCNTFDDPPNRDSAFTPDIDLMPTPPVGFPTTIEGPGPVTPTPVTPAPVVVTELPRPPIPTATLLPGAAPPPDAGSSTPDAALSSSGGTTDAGAFDAAPAEAGALTSSDVPDAVSPPLDASRDAGTDRTPDGG